jgi:hypothetical protein
MGFTLRSKQFLIAASLLVAIPCGATVPMSGLKVWLQADSLGLSDGTAVSSWTDISGNGFNAAQATGGQQPVFKTAIRNGKPIVRFDGTDDVLGLSGSALGIFNNIGGGTVFVVCSDTNNAAGAAGHYSVVFSSGTTGNRIVLLTKETVSQISSKGKRLDADANIFSTATYSAGFHVLTANADWSGNSNQLFVDGVGATATAYSGGGNTSATNSVFAGVGANTAVGANAFPGDIAEVLVFNRVLTATERNQVHGYLGSKYNIAVTGGIAPSGGFFLWFMGIILKPIFEWRQHGFILI